MKSLLYRREPDVEFVMKFEELDLQGLLDIAVDDGSLDRSDVDKILEYINDGITCAFIGDQIVFEQVEGL